MLVNIYHDGKIGRGIKAKIIKNKGKRILLEFYNVFEENTISEWFVKVKREQNGSFENKNTNYWYYPYRESVQFKEEIKDCITGSYYDTLFK